MVDINSEREIEDINFNFFKVLLCIYQMGTVEYGFPTIGGLMPVSGTNKSTSSSADFL